jgi:hypothetical protein
MGERVYGRSVSSFIGIGTRVCCSGREIING